MGCGDSKGVDVLNVKTEPAKEKKHHGQNKIDENIHKINHKTIEGRQKQNEGIEDTESEEKTDSETERSEKHNEAIEDTESEENTDSETEQGEKQNEAIEDTESGENTDSETEQGEKHNEAIEDTESEENSGRETERGEKQNEAIEEIKPEENSGRETERGEKQNEAIEEIKPEENSGGETERGEKQNKAIEEIKPEEKHHIETERQRVENKAMEEIESRENRYKKIDEHAKKAPNEVKQSSADLVNYMASCTKDPEYLVRGFFIWISENIKYDVDGFFGRSEKRSCDSQSVMVSGKSVCAGYANVMEELCRQANIPVKNITGFAKGFGHSAEQVITEQAKTNHAWNAVQLAGKWYLLDSTWGSGHLNQAHQYEKEFNEFYFLTNPYHLITSHIPYMDKNMEESMKWQLLDKPISLSDFSRSIRYWPGAFKLGARAVSHTDSLVEMKNELKMKFKSTGQKELIFTGTLDLIDGNSCHKQENATYGYLDNGCYTMLVHPCKPGTYKLNIFGRSISNDGENNKLSNVTSYTVKCSAASNDHFQYPQQYPKTDEARVILREPLSKNLPANSEVFFKIESPLLQMMRVNNTTLQRTGNMFTGLVTTGNPEELIVWGNKTLEFEGTSCMLAFKVVKK